jgi:UDP-N-acetylmuramoyl-L-alanyl-D-glutamate--2,6-diaminopimelate ligase
MEVSSHALVQSRVDGIHFDVAVFTNLSHDHLDYHGSMEDYFEAKAKLFTSNHALRAVVNADDTWGRLLLERGKIPMTAVHHADAGDVHLRPGHTEFTWRGHRVATQLTGSVNVDNTLLAAEAALALDLELEPAEIAAAMVHLRPVPGRLQVIAAPASPGAGAGAAAHGREQDSRPPFTVLVDYAHTPAGLEVVLAEARRLGPGVSGRVITVFGCGGNRDRAKRPVMGAVAVAGSEIAILTSDNPRDEDPLAIIEEVLTGVDGGRKNPRVVVEEDRRVAIRRALDAAEPGDVVVIAGKGHETYQEIGGRRLPFDDAVEARDALTARFASDPGTWVMPVQDTPASTDGPLSASASRGSSAES